jgi:hypothetical protein
MTRLAVAHAHNSSFHRLLAGRIPERTADVWIGTVVQQDIDDLK